jgi:hypothetical protein
VAPGPRLAVPARARHDPEDELQDHEDDDDADDERERRETAVTPATLEHDRTGLPIDCVSVRCGRSDGGHRERRSDHE